MTIDAEIETELAELRATAPSGLARGVMVEVGLADRFATIGSPIGPLFVAWNGLGVAAVEAAADARTFETSHSARTGRRMYAADQIPDRLADAIARRLGGDRRVRIDLDLRGHTDFEQEVWHKTLEIPRGEVRPYGWIAAEIGRPKAVRAVGTALGHNPVPLIVPCHRVIRTDGSIGQYSLGGPDNKRTILAAEGLDPDEFEATARSGVRYVGSDTTHIVCLPSCHAARRISTSHRVRFRSLDAALTAGYRPCKQCRSGSGAIAA
jgi:O-6-methylguanine DNA methyltransferase